MIKSIEQVAQFHQLTNTPILDSPAIPADRIALRVSLIQEELNELETALLAGDLVAVADALTDLQYVLDGAYLEFGMKNIKEALSDEVHRSNMTKFCTSLRDAEAGRSFLEQGGNVDLGPTPCRVKQVDGYFVILRSADNKVMKPLGYQKALLEGIVKRAK